MYCLSILKLVLFYFILCSNYVDCVPRTNFLGNSRCMENYRYSSSNISAFNVCKDHPCLLIKADEPHVIVSSENFTRDPIKCKDIKWNHGDGLRGSLFDLIDEIPSLEESYCIFNGDECSFDDQITFLQYAYSLNQSQHQFIVAGLMFIMSYRVNNFSISSRAFAHGPILIVGERPLYLRPLSFHEAMRAVCGPFPPETWGFIFLTVLFFIVVRIGISVSFTLPFHWTSIWWNIWGEYETAKEYNRINIESASNITHSNSEDSIQFTRPAHITDLIRSEIIKSRKRLEFYNKYWSSSAKVFVFVTVLFYELALFHHVFENSRPPYIGMRDLSRDEMQKFVLLGKSGMERYFEMAADPKMEQTNSGAVPWIREGSLVDVYDRILKNKSFGVTYDRSWDKMKRDHLCNKLTVYRTESKHSYYAGWFYSKDVPEKTRLAIDQNISTLLERGKANDILSEEKSGEECDPKNPKINFMLLFLPLLPLSLFLMIAIFLRILYHLIFDFRLYAPSQPQPEVPKAW